MVGPVISDVTVIEEAFVQLSLLIAYYAQFVKHLLRTVTIPKIEQ